MSDKVIIRPSATRLTAVRVGSLRKISVTRVVRSLVLTSPRQGPAGPDNKYVSYTAAVMLSGNRVVCLDNSGQLIYADNTIATHINKVLGLTIGAITVGSGGQVQTFGEMIESGWSWTPGLPIFLSTIGALTQVAPATGFILIIGFALTATKIFISIKDPIIRS